MKSLANEFFLTMETGAKDYQKQNPARFDLVTNGIKDETDTANQDSHRRTDDRLEGRRARDRSGRFQGAAPVLKKAVDAGIIVVNIDNKLDTDVLKSKDLNIPFVGPDNAKGALKVGDYLAKHLKAGDNVAIMRRPPPMRRRNVGRLQAAGHGDGRQRRSFRCNRASGKSTRATPWRARFSMRTWTSRRCCAAMDNMVIGAVSAVRAAGKAGKVQVVGYDDINAIKTMLADGRVLATANQYAARQAVFGIDTALKAISEHKKQSELSGVVETPHRSGHQVRPARRMARAAWRATLPDLRLALSI